MASFTDQLRALLWRNFLMKKRGWRTTLQEVLFPILLVIVLVLLHLAVDINRRPEISNFPSFFINDTAFSSVLFTTKPILAGPNISVVNKIMNNVVGTLRVINPQIYHEMRDDVTSAEVEAEYRTKPFFADVGVQFTVTNESGTLNVTGYTLRLPYQTVQNMQGGCSFKEGMEMCYVTSGVATQCPGTQSLTSGLVLLQYVIEAALIKLFRDEQFQPPEVSFEMMPVKDYSPGVSRLQILVAIYMVISVAPLAHYLTMTIVAEKEYKVKLTFKVMGLRDSVFWLSWFLTYMAKVIVIGVVTTIIMALGSFFSSSGLGYFFLFMLLYGASLINFGFFMSTFFTQSKVAGAVTSFLTVLFSMLYLPIVFSRRNTIMSRGHYSAVSAIPLSGQVILSLFSPVAFALGLDQAVFLDEEGLMDLPDTFTTGQYSLMVAIIMLIADNILYAVLAAYLDNVLPGTHRVVRKAWFCLKPSYWLGTRRDENKDIDLIPTDTPHGPHIEPAPDSLTDAKVIRIRDLTKRFNQGKREPVDAVNGLDLDIYEGQITCLLGHNGAGKTTLINMLTGAMAPTSGSAFVYDLNVSKPDDQIHLKKTIGYCPQRNILFPELTVEEHLRVCALIKGVPRSQLQEEVQTCLRDLGLTDKSSCYPQRLSGGQKRKLCVALALIGNSKVLLLDEPSTGLDPLSRRHLWSLLHSKKKDRVILLTTHHMAEADILADRKAVLSKGRLRCVGSSHFLKQKFGVGYHLNLVLRPAADTEAVMKAIKTHVRGAIFSRCHGNEMSITLPQHHAGGFASLFKKLESKERGADYLGINSYGISMTTLEEVFLKLEKNDQDAEEEAAGYSFISPLLTPGPDDVFLNDDEDDGDDTVRRTSSIKPLTDDTRRWTVFTPIRHHDDNLSDTSSRRVSAFPRLGSRTRSTSEEDDLNARGSRPGNGLTKRFSDIFGKKSSEVPPGGVETRPMRPTSLALNTLRGKESFSSYDESRVLSSQTRKEAYMKKKKSRASSMLMSMMKKSSVVPPMGRVGSESNMEEWRPSPVQLAPPVLSDTRGRSPSAITEIKRSLSVEGSLSRLSVLNQLSPMDADPLSKMLILESKERHSSTSSEPRRTLSILDRSPSINGFPSMSSCSDDVSGSQTNIYDGGDTATAKTPDVDIKEALSRMQMIPEGRGLEWRRFKSLVKLRLRLTVRYKYALYLRIIIPIIIALVAIALTLASDYFADNQAATESIVSLSAPPNPLLYRNLSGSHINHLLEALMRATSGIQILDPTVALNSTQDLSSVLDILSQNGSSYKMNYNYTCGLALPELMSVIYKAARLQLSPNNYSSTSNSSFGLADSLTVLLQHWPNTVLYATAVAANWVPSLFLGMALTITPTGYALDVLRCRKRRTRHMLRLTGVSTFQYWSSTFFVDFIEFFIPAIILFIACAVSKIDMFDDAGSVLSFLALVLLYIPVGILWAYFTSFAFHNPETCLVALPNIVVLAALGPFFVVHFLDTGDTALAAKVIHYIFTVCFPPYICFGCLHYISKVESLYREANYNSTQIPTSMYFDFQQNIAICLIMLGVDMVVLLLAVVILDRFSIGASALPCDSSSKDRLLQSSLHALAASQRRGDSNVVAERQLIQAMRNSPGSWPKLIVRGLTKVFREQKTQILAVRDAWFTLDSGQVLGLLGPSGAGKTTVMNMLSGDLRPTDGTVELESRKLKPGCRGTSSRIGYCPQHSPMWGCLTPQEHIEVYGALRGLTDEDIATFQEGFFSSLDIFEDRTKKVSEIADGVKRKLCFAISMLGKQSLVLLDEPSTGMDPRAKRSFWDTVTAALKADNRGAILTTQSMAEADALCSRITIMVNGDMKCLGTSQQLKSQYGRGYTLEVKLRTSERQTAQRMEMLRLLLHEIFPDMSVLEQFNERAIFKVPDTASDFSLARTFETLESLKRNLDLEEYSFSQATLEQVFLEFARLQREGESRCTVPKADLDELELVENGVQYTPGDQHPPAMLDTKPDILVTNSSTRKSSDAKETQCRPHGTGDEASGASDTAIGADAAIGITISSADDNSKCERRGREEEGGDSGAGAAASEDFSCDGGVDNPAFFADDEPTD